MREDRDDNLHGTRHQRCLPPNITLHVRTSPYYSQSNGKLERYHRSRKHECIRQKKPLNLNDAKRVTGEFVHTYNEQRLQGAIGYITPRDMLE